MKTLKRWYPAALVMCFIFLLSSTPGQTIEAIGLGKESYHINGHMLMFVALCLTYYRGTKNIMLSVFFTVIYGVFDELYQSFTPLRSSSFFDVFTDTAGALIAGGILWKLQPALPEKLKNWLNE